MRKVVIRQTYKAKRKALTEQEYIQHDQGQQNGAIGDDARGNYLLPFFADARVAIVADEPRRAIDLEHHLVTGVHAGSAVDAFELSTVANVDAGRTNLYAEGAVDTIAQYQWFFFHRSGLDFADFSVDFIQ